MILNYKQWQRVFLFCLGIFLAAAFCMKWMESDFIYNGNLFTIIGLEISYSKERIMTIFSEISPDVSTIVGYHLAFDFMFMIGAYFGIAALCMMARDKRRNKFIRRILLIGALLQALAFGCDIVENVYLLKWLKDPFIDDNGFFIYHVVVAVKWILALSAALLAIPFVLKRRKVNSQLHFLI